MNPSRDGCLQRLEVLGLCETSIKNLSVKNILQAESRCLHGAAFFLLLFVNQTQNRPRTMAEIQEQVRRDIEEGNRPRGLSQQAELYMPSTSRSSDWPSDHRADPMVAMAQSERVAEAEVRNVWKFLL